MNIRITCVSKVLSPLTHMMGVEGNEAVVMREPILCADGKRWVPVLSGNALRHRAIREPGARWLCERWRLGGSLSLEQLNLLFHGGNLTEKGGREATSLVAHIHELFPLLKLCGAALPKQILPGSLRVERGLLLCRENADRARRRLPEGWLDGQAWRPAAEFVDGYQYTRGDARNGQQDLLAPQAKDGASNLMIFAGQQVMAGALFVHGFAASHVNQIDVGCLLLCLRLWAAGGNTIGGQASRGHGRLETSLLFDGDEVDEEACVEAYLAQADRARKAGLALLRELFARDEPNRGKKKHADSEVEDGDAA